MEWSVGILIQHLSYGQDLHYDIWPNHVMGRLLDVAVRTERSDFRWVIEQQWISRLMSDKQVDRLHCRDALDAAEKYGSRIFMGEVYYIAAKSLCLSARPPNTATPAVVFSPQSSVFSPLQTQRLLSGFCSLVLLSERLRQDSVIFYQGFCHLVDLCKAWDNAHNSMGPNMPVHVLEKLAHVRNGVLDLESRICTECRERAVDALLELEAYVRETLADHFLGL